MLSVRIFSHRSTTLPTKGNKCSKETTLNREWESVISGLRENQYGMTADRSSGSIVSQAKRLYDIDWLRGEWCGLQDLHIWLKCHPASVSIYLKCKV